MNLQRKVKIDAKQYSGFVDSLGDVIEEMGAGAFSVAFVSDRRMKELNSFFRDKDSTTDVLSFPHEPDDFLQADGLDETGPGVERGKAETSNQMYLGDIVISVERAQKQAVENGLTLENEIKQLILHGILHLCGYDHETDAGEMNKRELQLRRKLQI